MITDFELGVGFVSALASPGRSTSLQNLHSDLHKPESLFSDAHLSQVTQSSPHIHQPVLQKALATPGLPRSCSLPGSLAQLLPGQLQGSL